MGEVYMECWFFFIFFWVFLFFFSSLHSLMILLFVEFLLLFIIFKLLFSLVTWFSFLIFLLLGVCVGSLGVSLMVSFSRGKGFSYMFSF